MVFAVTLYEKKVSGVRFQVFRADCRLKKTAGLIAGKTNERRTSNIEHRTPNKRIVSILIAVAPLQNSGMQAQAETVPTRT